MILRRALLVGDIHTEAELLAQTLAYAAHVDRILAVGDVVDGPGDPLACIALLREHGADVVRGNHERWVVQGHPFEPFDYPADALAWFAALPATREYDTPTGRLLLGHGIGDNDMAKLTPDTSGYGLECLDVVWTHVRARKHRWLAGGHTHVPMVRTIDGITFVNPGTLVRSQEPGFMIADFERGTFERWTLLPRPTLAATLSP
ncbi:MAG: metallophosphoesterase family protein [Kofleriaceae bacterium]|nr:metallophosphoesterase family protein [Kofleriaceae bacterium]